MLPRDMELKPKIAKGNETQNQNRQQYETE